MADSLRDQLLKSGIAKQVREEKRPNAPKSGHASPYKKGPKEPKTQGTSTSSEEFDLAKAYAIRARTEAN